MTRAAVIVVLAIAVLPYAAEVTPVRLGLLAAAAVQPAAHRFAYERPIVTAGAGPQRLEVDVAVMSGAAPFRIVQRGGRPIAEGGLADLRLFDEAGGIVPYLLVHPPVQEAEWLTGRILPLAVTSKTSGFEVDLGAPADVDMIRVEGLPAPFLKRFVLEGSGDRARWTMLAPEGTLFDLPGEGLRQTTMPFPHGRFRYLRVTWDDTNSGRVPVPRTAGVRRRADAAASPPVTTPVGFERRPSEPGRSRYLVRLPAARLPIVALELTIAGGHVFRTAAVMESRLSGAEAVPVELGRATLTRVVRDGLSADSLRIAIGQPAEAELELVIEDGSNPPLDIDGIAAVFAELPWIYFETTAPRVVARYGDPTLERPSYDLEAVRAALDLSELKSASWDDPHAVIEGAGAAAAPSIPESGAAIDATAFRYARAIPEASGLVALSLDAAVLADSRGPSARFADVRVLDDSARQIPYVLERRDAPLSVDLTLQPAPPLEATESRARDSRESVYLLTLPGRSLPASTVVLETSARVFHRTVRIGVERPPDRRHRAAWVETLVTATWRHADQQTAAPALSLNVGTVDALQLLVFVQEGDNAPLPIVSARLLLPSYRLRFYHPGSGPLRLLYGRPDLQPPQYDLALLAPQVMGAAAREIAATATPDSAEAARPAFISPRLFWILLGGAVIVLLALIARLVSSGSRGEV